MKFQKDLDNSNKIIGNRNKIIEKKFQMVFEQYIRLNFGNCSPELIPFFSCSKQAQEKGSVEVR